MRVAGIKRNVFIAVAVFSMLLLSGSCGIMEETDYIYPIHGENIKPDFPNVTVDITNENSGVPSFKNFVIYYRFYLSDKTGESGFYITENFKNINITLSTHYNAIKPKIDAEKPFIYSNLNDLFIVTGYKKLALREKDTDTTIDAERVLKSNVLGCTLKFEFPTILSTNVSPTMTIKDTSGNDKTYILLRGVTDLGAADYPFLNTENLRDSAGKDNLDVEKHPTVNDPDFVWCAMYIIATGFQNISNLYSTPALIGVFPMPK